MKRMAVVCSVFLVVLGSVSCRAGREDAGQEPGDAVDAAIDVVDARRAPDSRAPRDGGSDAVVPQEVTDRLADMDVWQDILDGWDDWPYEGEPGWPCESHEDCYSGLCVEWWEGMACSPAPWCMGECPEGWNCRQYMEGLPDPWYECVLESLTLCMPCTTHEQCHADELQFGLPARCMDYGAAGSFCANECWKDSDCPEGYACQTWLDIDGQEYQGCRRKEGECDCSYHAATTGTSTTCLLENEFGTCPGERHCAALHELSECVGEPAAQETCDGEDNDCDGEVDEGCPCEPDCQGKECGDDGCGGSCGECAADETCLEGQCVL